MTARELERRVELWRALLAPEWRITLEPRGPHPDEEEHRYNAAVQADDDYLHARLWVRDGFYRAKPLGEVDVTIVHELVHLGLRELRRTLDELDGLVHRDVRELLVERFRTEEERLVERLARVIARLEHPDGLLYGVDVVD